jgi:hypothetical protein
MTERKLSDKKNRKSMSDEKYRIIYGRVPKDKKELEEMIYERIRINSTQGTEKPNDNS